CQMVLAALFARERTGRGQRVQTSLLQAVLALQSGNVVAYPGHEVVYRSTPTYRLYQGSDGEWFFLAVGNQSFWVKLCKAVGREDLAQDPRFGSWFSRRDHADVLMPLLEEAFSSKPAAEWVAVLAAHDIPAAATQSLREFMRDPAVLHHKMIVEYDHPELGPLSLMGQPLRFSETQAPDAGPPPLLGQHTAQILREAGYADHEIVELRRRGVVAGKDIPS
ncbi:MAG: CoA transferase, partial [Candidatus Rokuibacteriota bacterium]